MCLPWYGDFNPLKKIALTAVRRGIRVAFISDLELLSYDKAKLFFSTGEVEFFPAGQIAHSVEAEMANQPLSGSADDM